MMFLCLQAPHDSLELHHPLASACAMALSGETNRDGFRALHDDALDHPKCVITLVCYGRAKDEDEELRELPFSDE